MESGWERRESFLQLTPATIARMREPVQGAGAPLSCERLTGGLVNTNYRVQVAGSRRVVVVRVYVRDPDACLRDVALLGLVRGRVPIPELLFADASGARYERPYAVLSWVEGVTLTEALKGAPGDRSYHVGYAAGATLAPIGRHTFPQAGFFASDLSVSQPPGGLIAAFRGHIEDCLAAGTASRLGEPLATRVREFVQRNDGYLPPELRPAGLVHADYKAGNILMLPVDGRWTVTGVLDWEFAFAGPPLFDLGQLLRYADQLPPEFERGVVAGYTRAGGVLPPAWKRTVRLLDFVNLCDFLAMPEPGAARVHDVKDLLMQTMRDWPTYSAT